MIWNTSYIGIRVRSGSIYMRNEYLADLDEIRNAITEMGQNTVASLEAAVKALTGLNLSEAETSRQLEKAVDAINDVVDRNIIVTIARQAPAAGDVRFLVAGLKIATEIERVADYANNIAKSVQKRLSAQDMALFGQIIEDTRVMGERATRIFADVMAAYVARDAELANKIREEVAEINQMNKKIRASLVLIPVHNPSEQAALLEIHNSVRYLDRVADRSANIAEWVFYIATGFSVKTHK